MIIEYTCKFCQKPGVVEGEDSPDITFNVDYWKSILCCNRCADFMENKRTVSEAILKVCIALLRANNNISAAKLAEIKQRSSDILERLTKELATITCEYHHKSNVWEREFVTMLLEHPDQCWSLINHYIHGIAKIPTVPQGRPTEDLVEDLI